jgi:hypothetical protein
MARQNSFAFLDRLLQPRADFLFFDRVPLGPGVLFDRLLEPLSHGVVILGYHQAEGRHKYRAQQDKCS